MRQVHSIPHPKYVITVYEHNQKYQIKFEAGPMEQVYKIEKERIGSLANLEKLIDEDFFKEIHGHFTAMYTSLMAAVKRLEL